MCRPRMGGTGPVGPTARRPDTVARSVAPARARPAHPDPVSARAMTLREYGLLVAGDRLADLPIAVIAVPALVHVRGRPDRPRPPDRGRSSARSRWKAGGPGGRLRRPVVRPSVGQFVGLIAVVVTGPARHRWPTCGRSPRCRVSPDRGEAASTDPFVTRARAILRDAPLVDGHNDLAIALRERVGLKTSTVDLRGTSTASIRTSRASGPVASADSSGPSGRPPPCPSSKRCGWLSSSSTSSTGSSTAIRTRSR